ncbi:hypothetical protein ACIP1G_15555 [Pseudomonas sp. NPDC089392]|uniref:hypothetical protein n=1 Tax=Pseudomonas sp. NPDC089392 TaxID=3364459 RepID=UPI0037FF813D
MSNLNDVRFTFSTPADEAISFDVVSFELTCAAFLWAQLFCSKSKGLRNLCGSGRAREHRQSRCQPPRRLIRGRARSHKDCAWQRSMRSSWGLVASSPGNLCVCAGPGAAAQPYRDPRTLLQGPGLLWSRFRSGGALSAAPASMDPQKSDNRTKPADIRSFVLTKLTRHGSNGSIK